MTIEICPHCGGEIRAKSHEDNGTIIISGLCWNCGRLLAYSPQKKIEAPKREKPEGKVLGWVLRIWDDDRGWRTRKYNTEEEALLLHHVTELENRGQAYEYTEVRA